MHIQMYWVKEKEKKEKWKKLLIKIKCEKEENDVKLNEVIN